MTEPELLKIARGFGPKGPSNIPENFGWFRDELRKLSDDDLERIFPLCRSRWRQRYVMDETFARDHAPRPEKPRPTAWARLMRETY